MLAWNLLGFRITETFKLEKIFTVIESNCYPSTSKSSKGLIIVSCVPAMHLCCSHHPGNLLGINQNAGVLSS